MDIRIHCGNLEIVDDDGMSVRLSPKDVAELVSYLRIKLGVVG